VLIVALSYVKMDFQGKIVASPSHAFDTGAAWQSLALQAHKLGYNTRGMGGFLRDQARVALEVPEDYDIQAFIALGKAGPVADLPADFQAREVPTTRKPVREFVFEGKFPG
jgi:nitroreductase